MQVQLESERALYHFPGATAAFVLADGSEGSIAIGLGDEERGLPMQTSSRMPAGSIGKTFVAALTLALVAEGKIALDDKLSRWLGNEAWFGDLPNGPGIRISNLLNHSAGIMDHVNTPAFGKLVENQLRVDPGTAIEPIVLVGLILDQPPLFPVGEGYAYTDTGYILLQLALEKAGGFRFGEEVMRRFIYPLQLTSTSPADGLLHAGLAQGYVNKQSFPGLPETTLDSGILRWNPMTEWAGGGFISTSLDLAEWLTALFGGRAIPTEMVALMVSPANSSVAPEGYSYGLGIAIAKSAWGPVWRHRGVYPGYRSSVAYFPGCSVSVAVQINTDRITGEELSAIDLSLNQVVLNSVLPPNAMCPGAN